jgi:hypothetical protein
LVELTTISHFFEILLLGTAATFVIKFIIDIIFKLLTAPIIVISYVFRVPAVKHFDLMCILMFPFDI